MSHTEKMEKMCRACLSTDAKYSELISLFTGGCASEGIPTKMMNISNVTVDEKDGLPQTICQKCVFLIKVTDCFKNQLQLADKELRKIWGPSKGIDSNNFQAADGIEESEIEDLAFDPLYISDEVKKKVERAFTMKHQTFESHEFREMSDFLTNLEKKRGVQIKSESSDHSHANDMSYFEDSDRVKNDTIDIKSDEFSKNEESDSEEIVKMDVSDYSENSSEDNLKIEILESEKSSNIDESQLENVDERETTENMKNAGSTVTISDTSETESKSEFKINRQILPNGRASSLLGSKRKSVNGKMLKKASVTGMPKIQVRKVFQNLQVGKSTKKDLKPRTFFLCTTCDIRLRTVAAVLLHHNEVHSPNDKSLHCRMCDKSFPTKSHLVDHFDQHVETHLFRCSYCPNEFVLKANLTRHMLNHTKENDSESASKRLKTSDVVDSIDEQKIKSCDVNSTKQTKLIIRDVNSMHKKKPENDENENTKRNKDSGEENDTKNS